MRKGCFTIEATVLFLAITVLVSGCSSMGPRNISMDRTNYSTSITESWKRQVLLNIVKIRYVDPLIFVDIGDIVAGYTLETGGNAGLTRSLYDLATTSDVTELSFGVTGKYTDRPTITYKPMTGATFRRSVMSPMPLHNVILGVESGISAEFLFNLVVRSFGNINNIPLSPKSLPSARRDFSRVVEIISELQAANSIHIRSFAPRLGAEQKLFLSFGRGGQSSDTGALLRELQVLLRLDPALNEYELVSGPASPDNRRIAMQTYSLMQIMAIIASRVEVPQGDIDEHRAIPAARALKDNKLLGAMAVHTSGLQPMDAFTSVQYRDHWFYVDDTDIAAKRVFSFLMLAFTMAENKSGPSPQVTIPIQ